MIKVSINYSSLQPESILDGISFFWEIKDMIFDREMRLDGSSFWCLVHPYFLGGAAK